MSASPTRWMPIPLLMSTSTVTGTAWMPEHFAQFMLISIILRFFINLCPDSFRKN